MLVDLNSYDEWRMMIESVSHSPRLQPAFELIPNESHSKFYEEKKKELKFGIQGRIEPIFLILFFYWTVWLSESRIYSVFHSGVSVKGKIKPVNKAIKINF